MTQSRNRRFVGPCALLFLFFWCAFYGNAWAGEGGSPADVDSLSQAQFDAKNPYYVAYGIDAENMLDDAEGPLNEALRKLTEDKDFMKIVIQKLHPAKFQGSAEEDEFRKKLPKVGKYRIALAVGDQYDTPQAYETMALHGKLVKEQHKKEKNAKRGGGIIAGVLGRSLLPAAAVYFFVDYCLRGKEEDGACLKVIAAPENPFTPDGCNLTDVLVRQAYLGRIAFQWQADPITYNHCQDRATAEDDESCTIRFYLYDRLVKELLDVRTQNKCTGFQVVPSPSAEGSQEGGAR